MYEISNDTAKGVITIRASGVIRPEEMREALAEYKRATAVYKKGLHMLLADMRGLRPLAPEAAAVMGEFIAWGRQNGVVVCAHLSDSGIVRLQAGRIAREISPNDDKTVEVVSEEEAWKLFEERRVPMFPARRP